MAGTKADPTARTVAVKLGAESRGQLMRMTLARIEKGATYEDTTQAAVVRDALKLLHDQEVGTELTGEQLAAKVQAKMEQEAGAKAQLQAEHQAMMVAEGLPGLPWEHFMTIRKLRIEKGTWTYGTNQPG